MLEDVRRLPMSMSESEGWTPDWRNCQAMAYLDAYNERFPPMAGEGAPERFARALAQGIRFPAWEDDGIVKARFRHAAGAAVPGSDWTAAFDIGEQLVSANPETLEAASVKAWLLVGQTDEEIAARHPLTPFQVRVFHDTWFDVRGRLLEREMLLRVVCGKPPASDPDGWQEREIRILWTALSCGSETLDRLLNPPSRLPSEALTDEELEWLAENRRRARAGISRSRAGGFGRVRPMGRLVRRE